MLNAISGLSAKVHKIATCGWTHGWMNRPDKAIPISLSNSVGGDKNTFFFYIKPNLCQTAPKVSW